MRVLREWNVYMWVHGRMIPLRLCPLFFSVTILFILFLSRTHFLRPFFLRLFAFIFSHQSYTNPRRWGLPGSNLLDYQNQNLFYSAKILASQSPRCGGGGGESPSDHRRRRIIVRSCAEPSFILIWLLTARLNVSFIYTPWLIDFFAAIDVPFEPRITNDTCSGRPAKCRQSFHERLTERWSSFIHIHKNLKTWPFTMVFTFSVYYNIDNDVIIDSE